MADKKTKLADNKIKPTHASVEDFLNTIPVIRRIKSKRLSVV